VSEIFAFLELEGAEGESQDAQYTSKIELLSVQLGATNGSSGAHGTGLSVSKGQLREISCTKFMDRSSPVLMKGIASGTPFKHAKITLLKLAGGKKIPYLEMELEHVMITSVQFHNSNTGKLPGIFHDRFRANTIHLQAAGQ
jgi:type VI secretion system secreted protein Hcp